VVAPSGGGKRAAKSPGPDILPIGASPPAHVPLLGLLGHQTGRHGGKTESFPFAFLSPAEQLRFLSFYARAIGSFLSS
jgi:hypothetical protein